MARGGDEIRSFQEVIELRARSARSSWTARHRDHPELKTLNDEILVLDEGLGLEEPFRARRARNDIDNW